MIHITKRSNEMKNYMASAFFLLSISTITFGQVLSDSTCVENCEHPGYRLMSQEVENELLTREYILHVPFNYNADVNYPLVIVYHGFGDCAAFWADAMENFYGFNDLADEEGFLVAYPQAAYRPAKEDVYWEPGNSAGENIYENDVYFTQEMINHIAQDYSINLDEVYAAGYSNGGMIAHSVGCSRGDLVAGVGIMSGAMLDGAESCDDTFPVPVIIFHGVGDYVLPYYGDEWYGPVSETVDLWLNHNQIPANSLNTYELNGGDVTHDQYAGGYQGACLSFYTIHSEFGEPGGHVWFSQDIEGVSPNKILWDFFNDGCDGEFTSVSESEHLETITVFPNPFENQVHLSEPGSESIDVKLINQNGQSVLSGKLKDLNDGEAFLDLPSGLYILVYGNETKLLMKE